MSESMFEGFEEDYDPLEVDDSLIDQEDMDDENPYDTVDYPTMRNMPESMRREAVYTPARMGSAHAALLELFDHNPARRNVLLGIIDVCRDGCAASVVKECVDELQKDNLSVYAPMTLCRMLERAGALTLEMPQVANEVEDAESGVEYLEIRQKIDPVWHATEDGLAVYDELTDGSAFRDIVLDRDSAYLDVYLAVMEKLNEEPCGKAAVDDLVDTFEAAKNPRRFGGHFIDMLERVDAAEWKDRAWRLTDFGKEMIPVVRGAVAVKGE